MKPISGGMIGDFNYIGTRFDGQIQNISTKRINPIQFLQKRSNEIKMIKRHIGLDITN